MTTKLKTTLAGVAVAGVLLAAAPVAADKPSEPSATGVVERFDTLGGHGVGPVLTDVGGETLAIFVMIGWDDSTTLCTGGPPVPNGVQQNVHSPSGNTTIIVHNADIPILVFDVTDVIDEQDFVAKCASGELVPIATGVAKQRPIIHVTDVDVTTKVKTRGVVIDSSGQQWTMQSFFRSHLVFGQEETTLQERITLTPR